MSLSVRTQGKGKISEFLISRKIFSQVSVEQCPSFPSFFNNNVLQKAEGKLLPPPGKTSENSHLFQ